ncbi:MAG: tetratricopeptide repeat protein [Terriglobia bacterium]
MRFSSFLLTTILLLPLSVFGASKEQMEMQRDIAQLQQQVTTLQSTVDSRMAALQTLVQQAVDSSGKANTGVSVISAEVSREVRQSLAPLAGLAAKIDNTNNDVSDIRNQLTDLNSQMNKVLRILTDMNDTLKVIQSPPAAPPPSAGPAGGPPVVAPSAQALFENAQRDQQSGKLDLALSEYADFLKFHPDDPNCAGVQFNIGEIHYTQNKMDLAVQDFDAVIERYSDNVKLTPDAYFMKGMALKGSARRDAAATTFNALVVKFPRSTRADEAKEQLRTMGYTVHTPTPPGPARRKLK